MNEIDRTIKGKNIRLGEKIAIPTHAKAITLVPTGLDYVTVYWLE